MHRPSELMAPTTASHLEVQNVLLSRGSITDDHQPEAFSSKVSELCLAAGPDPSTDEARSFQELRFSGVRYHSFANENELIQLANEHYIKLGVIDSFSEESQAAIMSLTFNWTSYSFIPDEHNPARRKLVMNSDPVCPLKEATSSAHRAPIYLVPTDQEGYTLFLFEARGLTSPGDATEAILSIASQREMEQGLEMPIFRKTGKFSRAGRTCHFHLANDFKSGLNTVRPSAPAVALQGRLVIGMVNFEMLGVLEHPVWLAFLEEKDFVL
jgi:hypothetical protein